MQILRVLPAALVAVLGEHPVIDAGEQREGQREEDLPRCAAQNDGEEQQDQVKDLQKSIQFVHAVAAGHEADQTLAHMLTPY